MRCDGSVTLYRLRGGDSQGLARGPGLPFRCQSAHIVRFMPSRKMTKQYLGGDAQ